MVESQIANLTPDPSFGHNLCFRCPNGSCEPILDICISMAFQWYENLFKPSSFGPCNHSLNIRESTGSPPGVQLPTWEFTWECEGFFLHTFLHFRGHENVTLGFSLGPNPCKPFALIASPRLGL